MADDDSWYDPRFDPYMIAVGRIAIMWAHLEYNINEVIWELANVESAIGACVTAQIISPAPRMRALIAIAHYRGANETILGKLNKFARKIQGLGGQRNEYVHHPVSITKESGNILRVNISADKRLDFDFKPVNLKSMKKLFRDVRTASLEFDALYDQILRELPPWPRTQFSQSVQGVRRQRSQNS